MISEAQKLERAKLPAIGIYRNLLADVYHSWKFASHTNLSALDRSPKHCWQQMNVPEEPTPAKILGDALHYAILQPELFGTRYVFAETCCEYTKTGIPCDSPGKFLVGEKWLCGKHVKKDRFNWQFAVQVAELLKRGFDLIAESSSSQSRYFKHKDGRQVRLSDHAPNAMTLRWMLRNDVESIRVDLPPYGSDDPRTVLSPDDKLTIEGVRESVWAHPTARQILEARQDTEISAVWKDPESGVLCKMRNDAVCPNIGTIGDLKSTDDAGRRRFERTIFEYGYHRQGAIYLEGWAKHGLILEHFVNIAFEKKAPYCCAVYRIEDDALEVGREEFKKLVARFGECLKKEANLKEDQQPIDAWPGYSDEAMDISLPAYAWKQLANEAEAIV